MKHILTLLLSFTALAATAQPWNFIGSGSGINNASEVDIEISAGGQLFMAYIDTDNSNKITVRKWSNQLWQLVGTAGQGSASSFGLKLVMNGENPVVAAKYVSSGYEYLECYAYNGTSWIGMGVGTYFWTYHSKDFSISCNTTGDIFATYYNREYQTFPEGLITVKLSTGVATQVGGTGTLDDGGNGFLNNMSSLSTTGNNVYTAFEEDEDMDYGIAVVAGTTSSHPEYNSTYGTDASKIVFEQGLNSSKFSLMHLTENYDAKTLYYRAFNPVNNTSGAQLMVATSTLLTDFDFASQDANTFVFYRMGSTCYFKQITGDMTPSGTITTITSGTALCPGSATSLNAETNYGVHVIAYVDGGKCYVKEYNTEADIDDWTNIQMCEGSEWDGDGYGAIYIVDNNFSQANVTLTCTSQNTAVIPQSAINVVFDGVSQGYLNISTTNDVSAATTIDLKWDLYENGVLVATQFASATVYNTPSISFNFPAVQACQNAAPISLLNKATPPGGTWSGAGVSGTSFNPSVFSPSPTTSTYLVYSKTSPQGCTAKDSILFSVNQTPNLAISTMNAACDSANGTASVTISGGTPSYTSYWSNGSTFTSISGLAPGQYYFNTTDANGCIAVGVASVGSNGITLSNAITHVTCNGASTGGVNITVNGSNPPFAYAWSNGASTQDISNVPAGNYEVTITDNNNCISTASYTVQQPAPITLASSTTSQPACGTSTGTATVSFTGGSQPFDYQWQDAMGMDIGTNSPTISSLSAGHYSVVVVDDEGCTHSEIVLIQNQNGPVIVLDTVTPSDCSNNGTVDVIDVNGGSTFTWSNGATTQNLSNVGPGTYILDAMDANSCITVFTTSVPAAQPEAVDICLVTVDTNTNTNLIVWEKPMSSTIDHFNVYRETSQAGVYQLAGTVPYADLSTYNDLVASPSVRSWRYKISSVDGCGVESDISDNHKTVHLVINQGLPGHYNLIWDSYEGFTYSQFKIYRHTDINDWELLTTMPINLFTYTDQPPSENELEYLVTIDAPTTCHSTKSAQDFNTTRSNKDRAALEGQPAGLEELLNTQTYVYPVPSSGTIHVTNSSKGEVAAQLRDQTGRIIQEFKMKPGTETLNLDNLSTGIYTLTLTQNDITINKRVIIQR